MTSYTRIVIKVGSNTLTGGTTKVDRLYVAALVNQLCDLRERGVDVVLVSSGAIAAGLEALALKERPTDMPSLQAAASVGQVKLVETYAGLFGERGIIVGQVLLTRHDTGHRESYLHARHTFERLLAMGTVPIVNENDTVAVEEIRFGDNDTLAALVATRRPGSMRERWSAFTGERLGSAPPVISLIEAGPGGGKRASTI